MMHYQIFGSEDSQDLDLVFFVDTMPGTIRDRSLYCARLVQEHFGNNSLYGQPVNANLAILRQGRVDQVYKGTADELNNALYYTYGLHRQDFPNLVRGTLPRDTDLKLIRCVRMMLSALSRTQYRAQIKAALQRGLADRLETLQQVELAMIRESSKGYSLPDTWKLIAFQCGQSLALVEGKELYTKGSVATRYPALEPYLYRKEGVGTEALQLLLDQLISSALRRLPFMKSSDEYLYTRQ